MTIKISELKEKLENGLQKRGLTQSESEIVANGLVEAEKMNKKTHGISKVFVMEEALKTRGSKPKILKDKGNYALVDGQKEIGLLSASFALNILLEKVKSFDNAMVGMTNSFYYTMAGIFAKQIAEAGYIGIVINNGGPAIVTPYGGIDPILGTNPIAIGIPTSQGPLVLDMATSEQPWGEVNLAKVENRSLADKSFLDKEGKFTIDPDKAEAIVPFAGYKGYGLNFMIEILTGAFVSAKMGLQSQNAYDLGFLFMAYAPDMFTTKENFDSQVVQLITDIKKSRKLPGVSEIYVPGDRAKQRINRLGGFIDISDSTYNDLCEFENGVDINQRKSLRL